MKRVKLISGIILLVLVAAGTSLNAQRGMRGQMRDTLRTGRSDTDVMNRIQMHRGMMPGRPGMHGMRQWRNPYDWQGPLRQGPMGRWGYDHNPGFRGRGMYPFTHKSSDSTLMNRFGHHYAGRNGYLMENIPDLTDNQKAKMKDLIEKNQAEMQKFRDETAASMKKMREQHREKMMEVLNPEQKKWLESRMPAPGTK